MDFLVHVDNTRLHALPPDERELLTTRERQAGRQLMADGVLRSLWRLPGKRANVGIWTADDADALHDILTGLPIWPYAEFEITPLATHPLTSASGTA